jgi:hypothetical protein
MDVSRACVDQVRQSSIGCSAHAVSSEARKGCKGLCNELYRNSGSGAASYRLLPVPDRSSKCLVWLCRDHSTTRCTARLPEGGDGVNTCGELHGSPTARLGSMTASSTSNFGDNLASTPRIIVD